MSPLFQSFKFHEVWEGWIGKNCHPAILPLCHAYSEYYQPLPAKSLSSNFLPWTVFNTLRFLPLSLTWTCWNDQNTSRAFSVFVNIANFLFFFKKKKEKQGKCDGTKQRKNVDIIHHLRRENFSLQDCSPLNCINNSVLFDLKKLEAPWNWLSLQFYNWVNKLFADLGVSLLRLILNRKFCWNKKFIE